MFMSVHLIYTHDAIIYGGKINNIIQLSQIIFATRNRLVSCRTGLENILQNMTDF